MNETISVLLIEDDLVDQKGVKGAMAQMQLPYGLEIASTVASARRILAARFFDVILADFQLPDGTSFELFDIFENRLVIFITGSGDEETAVRALQNGAQDYVIKDPDRNYLKLLPYRIQAALRQWRSEQLVRESEARYRDLVENATDLIYTTAVDGRIQFVNHAWLTALDYIAAEATALNIFDLIHPDDSAGYRAMTQDVLQGKSVTPFSTRILSRNGLIIHLEASVGARVREGQVIGARAICQNVTARKKHEQERDRLTMELQGAHKEILTLSNLLPMCAWCKKVRDDQGYWEEVTTFFTKRERINWTHGICPECMKTELSKIAPLTESTAAPESKHAE